LERKEAKEMRFIERKEAKEMRFIYCNFHLQEGDIITSKKGILQKSAISE
jgi:hypothetical protein